MRWVCIFLLMALPVGAQTLQKTPGGGGAYDAYVTGAFGCLADDVGNPDAAVLCITEAIEDCRSKAGVFESCLDALSTSIDSARERLVNTQILPPITCAKEAAIVAAELLPNAQEDCDLLCQWDRLLDVVARIAQETELSDRTWRDMLLKAAL